MIRSRLWGWKVACLLAGVAALALSYGPDRAPFVGNDGYQYLDAASNLAAGRCFCTDVALFDEQVAYGRLPVPFTHFAPGYPLLVAAVSRLGVSGERAGYLISAFAFLAVIWLLGETGVDLGAKPWVAGLVSLLWITHAAALSYAAIVGTESLFAAFLMGTVALVVRDAKGERDGAAVPLLIGTAAGLSYWVRYPGLFVAAGACLYLLARCWRRPAGRGAAAGGIGIAAVLIAAVQIRTTLYTGSWRGGFSAGGHQTIRTAVTESFRAFAHLLTGDRIPLRPDLWLAVFGLSAAWVVITAIRGWRRANRWPLAWAIFTGTLYCAGIFAATLTTIAADLPRYYFPVYPLIVVCLAVIGSESVSAPALIVFVAAGCALQIRNDRVAVEPPDWVLVRGILTEEAQPGATLYQWIDRRLGTGGPLLAVEGQAVHYLMRRPVIAVLSAEFTSRENGEQAFRDMMRSRHIRYLLILPGAPALRISEQASHPFLRALAAGEAPSWLSLAARTPDAAVYECADCGS